MNDFIPRETKLDVRAYPINEPKGATKAFASVSIDDMIAIRGIRVVDSTKGPFVSMPQSYNRKTNESHDIAFPLSGDLRKEISRAVLGEYRAQEKLPPEDRGYPKQEAVTAGDIDISDINLDVRIYPLDDPQGSTKAFASISIEDLIAIRGIRVVDGEKGLFVTMPQSQDNSGIFHDIAFPLNGDLRKEITKAVLGEYDIAVKTAERGAEIPVDRPVERKTLAEGLRDGAARAAEQASPYKVAAKSRAGALE